MHTRLGDQIIDAHAVRRPDPRIGHRQAGLLQLPDNRRARERDEPPPHPGGPRVTGEDRVQCTDQLTRRDHRQNRRRCTEHGAQQADHAPPRRDLPKQPRMATVSEDEIGHRCHRKVPATRRADRSHPPHTSPPPHGIGGEKDRSYPHFPQHAPIRPAQPGPSNTSRK